MERMAWEEYAEAEKYDTTFDKSFQIPYEEEEKDLKNEQNAKAVRRIIYQLPILLQPDSVKLTKVLHPFLSAIMPAGT